MKPVIFDALAESDETGPLFGGESEDLDFTLLRWNAGEGVAEHINSEVDVIMVVLQGSGTLWIDENETSLGAGHAVMIPKNTKRRMQAGSQGIRYLNVHKRRKRLMPGKLENRPRKS